MKRAPSSSSAWIKLPMAQRRHTAAWLQEWALAEHLALIDIEDTSADSVSRDQALVPPPADTALEPVPQLGEIRLLRRVLTPTIDEPVYVLVLAAWEAGLFLASPFSPFLAPASTGELASDRTEPALRVVCAWATVTAAPCLLAASWHVDQGSDALRHDTWDVFRHMATGAPVPRRLQARIGTPISDPLDPRLAHQRLVTERLAWLARKTIALFSCLPLDHALLRVLKQTTQRCALPLAAAGTETAVYPLLVMDRRAPTTRLQAAGYVQRLGLPLADPDDPDTLQERLRLEVDAGLGEKSRPAPGDACLLVHPHAAPPDNAPALMAHGLVMRNPQTQALLTDLRGSRAHLKLRADTGVTVVIVKNWDA